MQVLWLREVDVFARFQNQVMLLKVVFVVFLMDLVITCTGLCSPTCSVTGWGSWSNCSVSGTHTREKLYCCPQGITTIDECLQNCSIIRESPSSQACDYSGSKSVTSGFELITRSTTSEYNLLTVFIFCLNLFIHFRYWKDHILATSYKQ